MKKVGICLIAVLFVSGLFCAANAEDLTVYDSNNNPIQSSVAKATATNQQTLVDGQAATIKINATIPQSLSVSLSNTEVNWEIYKAGTYKAKIMDVVTTSNNTGPIYCTFDGIENLKNAEGSELKVSYKHTELGGNPPNDSAFSDDLSKLNATHELPLQSLSIWNKLEVPEGTLNGEYSDEFTMTFAQTL